MITKITVTTKANTTQETTWEITQARPYPDIEGHSSSLRWRNGGGVFPTLGGKVELQAGYRCDLLKEGFDEKTREDNRKDYAGYDGNKGGIVLRGVDLGEMSITLEGNPQYAGIRCNGFDHPTKGIRAWVDANLVPALSKAIQAHKDELRLEAIAKLKECIVDRLQAMRTAIDGLEGEAKKNVAIIEKG